MILSQNAIKITLLILSLCGIEISEDMAMDAVSAIVLLFTIGKMVYDQIKRPDTKFFLFKK